MKCDYGPARLRCLASPLCFPCCPSLPGGLTLHPPCASRNVQPLLSRIEGAGAERWEITGVVDVMDLAKIVLEAVKKEGHLDDLLPATAPKEADPAEDAMHLCEPSAAAEASGEDVDTISSAANCSCNNPTQTVAASDTLLQVCGEVQRAVWRGSVCGL